MRTLRHLALVCVATIAAVPAVCQKTEAKPKPSPPPAAKPADDGRVHQLETLRANTITKLELDYEKLHGLTEFQDYLRQQQTLQSVQSQLQSLKAAAPETTAKP